MLSQEKKTYVQKIAFDNFILRDHRVYDIRTLPGVTLLDMIYRLAREYLGTQVIELKHVLFKQPIVVSELFDKNVYVTFTPENSYWKVDITSQKTKDNKNVEEATDENMECLLFPMQKSVSDKKLDIKSFIKNCRQQWDMDDMYGLARNVSINHYIFMKTIGKVYQNHNEELMELHLSDFAEKFRDKFHAHPAFLDGATFAGSSFSLSSKKTGMIFDNTPYIPFMIERFCIYRQLPKNIYTYSRKKGEEHNVPTTPPDLVSTDITVFDSEGEVLVEFETLTLKRIREPQLIRKLIEINTCFANCPEVAEPCLEDGSIPHTVQDIESGSDIKTVITSYLNKEISKLLKEDKTQIDINQGFYGLGLDSANLLTLVKQLEQKLGKQLYPTLLFEYSNIQSLTEYLFNNHQKGFINQKASEIKAKSISTNTLTKEDASTTLIFEPVWNRVDINNTVNEISNYTHIIALFKGTDFVQQIRDNFGKAEIVELEIDDVGKQSSIEKIFNQVLNLVQAKMQQQIQGEVLIQLIADSNKEGRYLHTLSGLFKTAHIENPKICSQIITFDGVGQLLPHSISDLLLEECRYWEKKAEEIHYGGKLFGRYVKRLKEKNLPADGIAYKENGVYVIAGGLGGLGLMIADHITKKVKPKLALIGRSKLDDNKQKIIDRLIRNGAEVLYIETDISNRTDTAKALKEVEDKFGKINGVFHSAGVLKDQFIIKKRQSDIHEVFNPKVLGLWNIDNVLKEERLDFFVILSSLSAIMGNAGQADYASANAFMDVFAAERQEKVNKGTRYGQTFSINWPLWAEGGMVLGSQMEEFLFQSSGLKPLPTMLGLELMDRLMKQNNVQSAVFYGDEKKLRDYVKQDIEVKEEKQIPLLKSFAAINSTAKRQDNYSGDIAIIGIAGRYPMAGTSRQFYQNLLEGKDCISAFPRNRWRNYKFSYDVEQFYKFGGFVEDIDKFDPLFFNISPKQAEMMDPQARLFLQTVWEACEDAGFYADRSKHHYPSLSDKCVGVFAGVFWNHYELFASEMTRNGLWTSLGIASASIPNMVSYCMNFHGPSMAVDTMCSSSLTAIHLACESIRKAECHYAIAGGVNLVTHPHKYMFLKQAEFLSSEGKCRSFGEGGDGYVPGEGVGAALLTTLEQAEKEGCHIYGIIKGSAINHSGRTSGATVPDPVAQSEVISDAIRKSGIDPATISYIEAHGTGTSLGDPIEIQGLSRAFAGWTNEKQFCAIGSLKSNIGHLEAAAGIAGLTKLLLQFKYNKLFPSLHSEELNPYIPFNNTPFYVVPKLMEWKQPALNINGREMLVPRRAGISAFGANGSNAHIILEEYVPRTNTKLIVINERNQVLIPLSVKSKHLLKTYAKKLLAYLKPLEGLTKDYLAGMSGNEFKKVLQNDLIDFLSELTKANKEEPIHLQQFSELNLDYYQLDLISRHIFDEFGIEVSGTVIAELNSIDSLVENLIGAYHHELGKYLDNKRESRHKEDNSEISLVNLAYTLQTGREAMEHRMALVVSTKEELIEKLEYFVLGKDNIEGCFTGEVKQSKDMLKLLDKDTDTKELITRWIEKNNLVKVAQSWTMGIDVDWELLYGGNRLSKISLPTYPFEEERYWITDIIAEKPCNPSLPTMLETVIHPLVHKNTSNLSEQRYSSTFTGEEFFLADHVVKGKRMLPGVAFLEMARVAVQNAVEGIAEGTYGITFRNIVWARPVIVEGQSEKVYVALFTGIDGEIGYEIYGQTKDGSSKDIVYNQGSASIHKAGEAQFLDIGYLRKVCRLETITPSECYGTFQSMGIEYGSGHMGIEVIYKGDGEVLAKIKLPSVIASTKDQYVLHPCIMDSALQASIGLAGIGGDNQPFLPFALDKLEIFSGCTEDMWVHISSESIKSGERIVKYNIEICDETGKLAVRMKGLSSRRLESGVHTSTPYEVLMLEPCWKEQAGGHAIKEDGGTAYEQHVVVLCGTDRFLHEQIESKLKNSCCINLKSTHEDVGERYMTYAEEVFEELRSILKSQPKGKVIVQVVVPTGGEHQLLGGLAGLLKTARLENPNLAAQLIGIEARETSEGLVLKLKENRHCPMDIRIRYQGSKRQVEVLEEIETGECGFYIPWKDGGTYLIAGGTGGLGLIFTQEIARKVKAASVILTGRSPLSKERELRIEELRLQGISVEYIQADVSNREEVASLVRSIKGKYGALDGIIHSAGVVCDNFIIKKTREELISVMEPKVRGVVNLDEETKGVPMDFFILFSSGAGVAGNPGQADYAAGNAFMDCYAKYRNTLVKRKERQGRTLTVNWPLWKDGGMQVDEGMGRLLLESTGMAAMETPTGIKSLYQCLALGREQVMVLEGDVGRLRKSFMDEPYKVAIEKPFTEECEKSTVEIGAGILEGKVEDYLKKLLSSVIKLPADRIEADASFEKYGIDSVMVMQMTNELEKTFGFLPKTLFFEYQNIKELTLYFIKAHSKKMKELLGTDGNIQPRPVSAVETVTPEMVTHSRRGSRFATPVFNVGKENTALDIAIIGVSGKYPGARNVREFWRNLREGRDCITEIPKERWDYSLYFDEDRNKPGKTYSKWGGFIEGVDRFDPIFFNISPREAETMDPQERLFLQCVYETLEDAGYTRETLGMYKGLGLEGNIGVFVGVMYQEYQLYGAQEQVRGRNMAIGGTPASIANRVSYFCNFHGPSMAVDTMCSSSLTAIHIACQSIQNGGCKLAVAGGVNVSIHPNKYIVLGQGKFVSSKGRCESFGKGGDGYVPGEGVGAVLLKPLAKAVTDGDQIYGIIKGTAINHGGKTNGYTVPNPNAQGCAIVQALKTAGVNAREISYIEAHGTGTSLGDPIEIAGLSKAFSEYTKDKQYCAIGSVKSNIGHCESASGIAGITKVLLQLRYKQLVSSLHSEELNSNIDFDNTPFIVQKTLAEWKRPCIEGREIARCAGISSFGAGGANAHVVIQEYLPEAEVRPQAEVTPDNPAIIILSAKNEARLKEQAKRLLEVIEEGELVEDNLAEIAYMLQTGREAMDERIAFTAASMKELKGKLKGFLENGESIAGLYRGQVKTNKDTVSVFLADEELREALDKWVERRKYERLMDLWVKGLAFDWNKMYGEIKPCRISLPTYPFAEERYWIPLVETSVEQTSSHIHPMLHRNISNLLEQRYSSTFTRKDPFLANHVVDGKYILPEVVCLEMVRAAVENAVDRIYEGEFIITLKNIVWMRRMIIDEQPVTIHVRLIAEADGEIAYEIFGEPLNDDADESVYSTGVAMLNSAESTDMLDVQAILEELDEDGITPDQCYEAFNNMGIDYGPLYQGIQKIFTGTDKVLAKLYLPFSQSNTMDMFVLHPGLLDAALQSQVGLMAVKGINALSGGSTLLKPLQLYAMQEMEIYRGFTPVMWALIQYASNSTESNNEGTGANALKLEIDLYNEQGEICARIKAASLRALEDRALPGNINKSGFQENPVGLEEKGQKEPVTVYQENYDSNVKKIMDRISKNLKSKSISGTSCLEEGDYLPVLLEKVRIDLLQKASKIVNAKIEDIDSDNDLKEYGFDLFKLSELANRLNSEYLLDINPTSLLEYPSLRNLAEYLVGKYKELFLQKLE